MKTRRTKKILIVDDHPVFREGLAQLIACEPDLEVCAKVSNGAEAMAAIERRQPDLAILDISLKGQNGIELLKSMKAMAPDLRVIMCSMHDEMLYAERALRAGALGYLTKGEPVEKIIEIVRRVLDGEIYLSRSMNNALIRSAISSGPAQQSTVDHLSDRQLEIFELFGRGQSTRGISQDLNLSIKTVEVHRDNIRKKLGLKTALELTRFAIRWVDDRG